MDAQVDEWLAKAQQQEEANHMHEGELEAKYRTELNTHLKSMDELIERHDQVGSFTALIIAIDD